jgi:hypothetical protein
LFAYANLSFAYSISTTADGFDYSWDIKGGTNRAGCLDRQTMEEIPQGQLWPTPSAFGWHGPVIEDEDQPFYLNWWPVIPAFLVQYAGEYKGVEGVVPFSGETWIYQEPISRFPASTHGVTLMHSLPNTSGEISVSRDSVFSELYPIVGTGYLSTGVVTGFITDETSRQSVESETVKWMIPF